MTGSNKIRYLDLFAGCGGLTEGFEQTRRYQPVACVEWDDYAAKTLTERLSARWEISDAARRVIGRDIRDTDFLLRPQGSAEPSRPSLVDLADEAGGVDLVVGGPPCQAYSIAGRVRDADGMQYDYRNFLFEAYVELVEHFEPNVFVFENVPGMLSAKPGGVSITTRIREAFDRIGYQMVDDLAGEALFNLSEFGIPQRRRRVIIVGVRRNAFDAPQKALERCYGALTSARSQVGQATVRSAIGDLPPFHPLSEPEKRNGRRVSHTGNGASTSDHRPRFHNARDIEIFRALAEDLRSGDGSLNSVERIKELYTERVGKSAAVHKYYVLRWTEPSNTIPAHLHKDGLRHIHPDPDQARSITVREAARLQGFPDDYKFVGPQTACYKMIGNAVPPPFASLVAEAVADNLFSET